MATRLYLRDTDPGVGPSAEQSSRTAAFANAIRRELSLTKGSAQGSSAANSVNQSTAAQDGHLGRFVCATSLAGNVAANTWTLAIACSEGNAAANMFIAPCLYVWNPAGSVRGVIYDSATHLGVEITNTEDGQVVTFAGSAVSGVQAGDLLVYEDWRHTNAQSMAVAYAQTLYYDGATDVVDATTTDAASYLETPQDGLLVSGASLIGQGELGPFARMRGGQWRRTS